MYITQSTYVYFTTDLKVKIVNHYVIINNNIL